MKLSLIRLAIPFVFIVFGAWQCKPKEDTSFLQFPGKPVLPASIKNEHESLLKQVRTVSQYEDSTGMVARKLLELMEHHFNEEENYVLPPLGLLESIANDQLPKESKEVAMMIEYFKTQRQHLSAEHQMIAAHLKEMSNAAAIDSHDIKRFIQEVEDHAALEEEVLFPAAILIGDYLIIKLKSETESEKNIDAKSIYKTINQQ